jgi:hypothetical protein
MAVAEPLPAAPTLSADPMDLQEVLSAKAIMFTRIT